VSYSYQVSASVVRAWARRRGLTVGNRGHLAQSVIDAFNRAHRVKYFVNTNPSVRRAA
jgi:hypothetical protein